MLKRFLLDLLFKYKPLFKLFIWIDHIFYTIRNNSIEIIDRDKLRINGHLCSFYSEVYDNYLVFSEEDFFKDESD